MRIVCISDFHSTQGRFPVPDGDVLVVAGDMTMSGNQEPFAKVAKWLDSLPHRDKIVIAGNHDWICQRSPERARALLEPTITYLEDSGCEVEGLGFWGSPWQPWFNDWAFNLPRNGEAIREKWNRIPEGIDVLITHGPPFGVLDATPVGQHVGCEELAIRLAAVKPRLHVFGHIHPGYGVVQRGETTYVNACICNEQYQPSNSAIVVDLTEASLEVVAIPMDGL